MRKILFILLLLPFIGSAQVKQNYPQYGGTWKKLWLQDSGAFRLPIKIASTKDYNLTTPDSGQIYYRPSDSTLRYYTGFQWLTAGDGGNQKFGHPSGDYSFSENRYVNGHGSYNMAFDSITYFSVATNPSSGVNFYDYTTGTNRFGITSSSTSFSSPNGSSLIDVRNDSIIFNQPSGNYSIYNLPNITDTSANKVITWNASTKKIGYGSWFGGGGGGSPGGSNKQVQYNNSSAFGGYTGFEVGNTNNDVLITAGATTSVPLNIKLQASQSADALNISSSASTGDIVKINSASEMIFAGNSDAGDYDMQLNKGLVINNVGSGEIGLHLYQGTSATGGFRVWNNSTSDWIIDALTSTSLALNSEGGAVKILVASSQKAMFNSGGGMTLPEQSAPSTPASANSVIYVKSDGFIYGKDDAGVETKLSNDATGGIDDVLAVGQALTANRTIATGANTLTVSTVSGVTPLLATSTGGTAFTAQSTGGSYGVEAVATTGTGVFGNSLSGGIGVQSQSIGGVSLNAVSIMTSTNTIVPLIEVIRNTTGTAATGEGGSIDMYNETSGGLNRLSNQIISVLRNGSDANRQAQLVFTGLGNASLAVDTLATMGDYVNLTESSATTFTSTVINTGKIAGGSVLVTIEGNDGTDFQSRTLRFIWSAVNKAGTLTITLSTPEEVVALSSGTLTCTITATDGGSGVLQFKANAVSSLTQTTLRATYQTFKNF